MIRIIKVSVLIMMMLALATFAPNAHAQAGYVYTGMYWNFSLGGTITYFINQNGSVHIPDDSEFQGSQKKRKQGS